MRHLERGDRRWAVYAVIFLVVEVEHLYGLVKAAAVEYAEVVRARPREHITEGIHRGEAQPSLLHSPVMSTQRAAHTAVKRSAVLNLISQLVLILH